MLPHTPSLCSRADSTWALYVEHALRERVKAAHELLETRRCWYKMEKVNPAHTNKGNSNFHLLAVIAAWHRGD